MIIVRRMNYHNPVLLFESIDGLEIEQDGIYVDVTFGGGGHSKEILNRLGPAGQLYAFDQDKDALANAIDDSRFMLINQNFRHMRRFLRFYGVEKVDGILADLGVSSHQFDVEDRGFSTRFDAQLDMRMNQDDTHSAYHIVNDYDERSLSDVLYLYGELRSAKAMAKAIVQQRKEAPIKTSFEPCLSTIGSFFLGILSVNLNNVTTLLQKGKKCIEPMTELLEPT